MSCEYCKHESRAYSHHKDSENRDVYKRVAKEIPYDECSVDAEPLITWRWPGREVVDWAGQKPRLCVSAYDEDSDEICISIPIRHCPMCGRKLPTSLEVGE